MSTVLGVDGLVLGGRTGVGRLISDLLIELARREPPLTIRVLDGTRRTTATRERRIGELRRLGVEVHTLHRPVHDGLLVAQRLGVPLRLTSILSSDVAVYTRYVMPGRRGERSVYFVYDLAYLAAPHTLQRGYAARLSRIVESAVDRAGRIAVISNTMRDELARAYPGTSDRIVVIEPTVPNLPAVSREQAVEVLSRRGLRPGFVLHVGTIEPRKGLDDAVRAFSRLPAATMAAHPLVLLGAEGWAPRSTMEAIRRAPYVHWIWDATDLEVAAAYCLASLVVLPTLHEGFGLPLLEAMAAGVPVVANDLPVLREVGGGGVRLVNARDPEALAAALAAALEDESWRHRAATLGQELAGRYRNGRGALALLDAVLALVG